MPLRIVRNDITKMDCDAIVNAAKPSLLGGGGVDGAIHKAAGPGLLDACRRLGGCQTGEAKITRGYDLPCKYIIHTVGPIWRGGTQNEEQLFHSCYRSSLKLAEEYGCESVAFPLISTGAHGFPKREAFRIAMDTVTDFLLHSDMTVYLVVFGRESLDIGQKLFADIQEYIDDNYAESHTSSLRGRWLDESVPVPKFDEEEIAPFDAFPYTIKNIISEVEHEESPTLSCQAKETPEDAPKLYIEPEPAADAFGWPSFSAKEIGEIELDESVPVPKLDEEEIAPFDTVPYTSEYELPHIAMPWKKRQKSPGLPCQANEAPEEKPKELSKPKPRGRLFDLPGFPERDIGKIELDESFQQMLLRKIDESGMTDAECYKKSNIDRKLFSKIRKDVHYRPSKPTALAFAIALELDLKETNELLKKAGFALSHSFKFDVIIEYFIRHGNYNIYEINEALFAFDQSLLGG